MVLNLISVQISKTRIKCLHTPFFDFFCCNFENNSKQVNERKRWRYYLKKLRSAMKVFLWHTNTETSMCEQMSRVIDSSTLDRNSPTSATSSSTKPVSTCKSSFFFSWNHNDTLNKQALWLYRDKWITIIRLWWLLQWRGYLRAPSSDDHLSTCGAISRPPQTQLLWSTCPIVVQWKASQWTSSKFVQMLLRRKPLPRWFNLY